MKAERLPRHRRVEDPPPMALTERDRRVVEAVHDHRALRRDQIQRLCFPSKNRANARLKRLYQHRFLSRYWPPVRMGEGMAQPVYLLDQRGAQLLAQGKGINPEDIHWSRHDNEVGPGFLEHTLLINEVRIALTMGAKQAGYAIDRWLDEAALGQDPDRVRIDLTNGRTKEMPVIPDGYGVLDLGDRRSHLCLEADRATLSHRRWGQRIRAYLGWVKSGQYEARYHTTSLRVLTVTTGQQRLANLLRTTVANGGGDLFWFTTADRIDQRSILHEPIWQVAGEGESQPLICYNRT